nr:putative ribonuclease H-like domain-containing protein [Tanacetum cinerariifolium]
MNYKLIIAWNQSNGSAGKARVETVPNKDYILLPLWILDPLFSSSSKDSPGDRFKQLREEEKKDAEDLGNEDSEVLKDNVVDENIVYGCADDPNIPDLEEIGIFSDAKNDDSGADMKNLDIYFQLSPVPTTIIHKDHPLNQVIGDVQSAIQTRNMSKIFEEYWFVSTTLKQRTSHKDLQNCLFTCFLSQKEPKKVFQVLKDPSWIEAMQEELLQFKLQEKQKDERGIMIKNKERLVAQGYTREEGIHYDEDFALVARIEAIRLILAYASFKDIVVYQMDVKSAFRYGQIKEEVYVYQPPRFEHPNFPNRVYKVEKALYGLHQASRAWYETLSTYLLDNGFQRGMIDKNLFIKRDKSDILLVQVYVDDIIFGSTRKEMYTEFEKMMHKKFQMSFMGELTFFLGLQVEQKEDGIFINQDKYVNEILNKFGFSDVKTASTHMETKKPLLKDEDGVEVDVHMYRLIIGSLMYITSSRPDIMFAVCACARFQVNPKISHLHVVKRIFSYLKGQPKLGLWYPKDSPFDLEAYTNSDYIGGSLDRKSITGGFQFLGCRLISWQCKKQTVVANSITKAEYIAASNCSGQATAKAKNINGEAHIHAKVDGKKVIISEATIKRDLNSTMASAIICLATNQKFNFSKYIFESMVKHLDNGNKFLMYPRFVQVFLDKQVDGMSKHNAIYVIPSHTTKVFGNIKRVGKDFLGKETLLFLTMLVLAQADIDLIMSSAPQHTPIIQPSTSKPQKKQNPRKSKNKDTQETQPSDPTYEVLNKENVHAQSNDPPLSRVNTLRSGEDSLKLKELMELYTKLSDMVLNFLSARVESSAEEQSLDKEDASKQERNIADIDADAEVTLVDETAEDQGRFDDQEMFDTRVLDDEEVIVEKEPKIREIVVRDHKEPSKSTTIPTSIADSTRPKAKCIIMEEPSEATITTIPIPLKVQDKGKGIMVEEHLKMQKKDQISFDEQEARRLQVELDQEQRLTEEEAQKALEANIAVIEQ